VHGSTVTLKNFKIFKPGEVGPVFVLCIGQQHLGRCEVMEVHARGQLEHNIHCQHHLITCGRTADLCQLHTHSVISSLTLELPKSKGTAPHTSPRSLA
jgi:hypothetical protein